MRGATCVEQLRQAWLQAVFWMIGLFVLNLIIMSVVQDSETLTLYKDVFEQLPPALLSAFGLSDAQTLTSAEGFIAFAAYTYGILGLAVYGILSGMNITANDEDDGIMDVLLSLPLPRWQIIVERYAAYVLLTVLIALGSYVGIVLGAAFSSVEVNLGILFQGALNTILPTVTIMALTVLLTGFIRNKLLALGISGAVVLGSYLLNAIANAVNSDLVAALQRTSLFYYADSERVILDGLQLSNVLILVVISLACVVFALVGFQRRDVG